MDGQTGMGKGEAVSPYRGTRRLLCTPDYIRDARPNCACWLSQERRAPVPIAAPDLRHWLVRHEVSRAVYITRRAPSPRSLSPR